MEEEKEIRKKLYRSKVNRYLFGVCGGLGEYFDTDANVFRLLFLIFTFVGGIGIILYIAALIIVPENPTQTDVPEKSPQDKTLFWALLFIVLGFLLLFRQMGLFDYFNIWAIPWSTIWAIFLIAIGVLLVYSANKTGKSPDGEETSQPSALVDASKIHRSRHNRMIAGVCGGLGEYFKIDPAIVRLLWVLASLASIGLGILVYILLAIVFPEERESEEIN